MNLNPTTKANLDLPFNKVIGIEDFSHPELSAIIQDVFQHEFKEAPSDHPAALADRKIWEISMSIRALRQLGALHPEAVILGVGAGTEVTSYYLTKHAKQVFVTDIYAGSGNWEDVAPALMLVDPSIFAPYSFEQQRMVVQHMDGRLLEYPDNTFDGIYSSGSIEHFGSIDYIANAAYEMGRVLKPGGILTLSTEFKVAGPPNGIGWDKWVYLFSTEKLHRYIIEASGLELVGKLDTDVSETTMLTKRDLVSLISDLNKLKSKSDWQSKTAKYPNIVLVHKGYVFCSVHITLRKPEHYYPVADNEWAKPSEATEQAVLALRQQAIQTQFQQAVVSTQQSGAVPGNADFLNVVKVALSQFDQLRVRQDISAQQIPILVRFAPLGFGYKILARVRKLGTIWAAQAELYHGIKNVLGMLGQRLSQIESKQQVLENKLNHEVSQIRQLQHQARAEDSIQFKLDGEELTHLIRQIEENYQQLATASVVNVLVSPQSAEPYLFVLTDYFGERIQVLQVPQVVYSLALGNLNDLKRSFDADFSSLVSTGYFVLLSTDNPPTALEGMRLQESFSATISNQQIFITVWQKHKLSSAMA